MTMDTSSAHEVTQLLLAWGNGNEGALAELAPLVEAELHRLARLYLSRERPGHTLQPTALVNEAYLRLIDWKNVEWKNRAHFIGVAAQMMRNVLINHALRRRQQKRGGDALRVSLVEAENQAEDRGADLIALDDAMKALARFDARKSRIVELKFFGGLNEEEIAEVMKLSLRTVQRDWNLARAWLYNELSKDGKHDA
ncbi:MAG TPA: sigma-70 family RNA polymerase sigma factor [Blastocatellia bacterium]|nr:sigma-70 family RNA polymerase sigma factor [Blastocatellia bacterium]HMV82523.1 sigma-70 family RNA polymerase sigma factor [Blastocatellia bacterium]HMX24663.1 sigma-70 family RNA polymerase sigma factor [Blastocatellia bacterium]HMY76240.1 sigma-70 family RNA polymerase sigma factor [Blastocatellia bacterium]HMZ18907.1 sigma-70 family RNA polymerase sigma factor [Blastocatellia bacterium]